MEISFVEQIEKLEACQYDLVCGFFMALQHNLHTMLRERQSVRLNC